MKIKMKSKKIRGVMSAAALLLALTLPPSAHGQSDGFFNNADGTRDGNGISGGWNGVNGSGNGGSWNDINGGGNGGSWNDINGNGNGAVWNGLNDATPVGGGLLVLALSGVCYAAARVKRLKSKD